MDKSLVLRIGLSGLCIVLCSLATPDHSRAQAFGRVEQIETNVGTYYHFLQPGAATVQVYVMGSVGSPGVYEVSTTADLAKLLTLARASVSDLSDVPGVKEKTNSRETIVRLFRQQPGNRVLIYENTMDRTITNTQEYPALQDGDMLIVETVEQKRFSWQDGTRIVQTVGILSLVAYRLIRLF